MSEKLINLSRDLTDLRNQGYDLEVREGFLLLHSIPYVNAQSKICMGTLASSLILNNEQTQAPDTHTVWFSGEHPCKKDGSNISAIQHSSNTQTLCSELEVNHMFSCKPKGGYSNYYDKMTRYIEIILNEAKAIDPSVTAQPYNPIRTSTNDTIFSYIDSASNRASITHVSKKCSMRKIAIIGLGGSGSYALDLLSKCNIKEIHLFDGDCFLQHNAFRAPGAASLEELSIRRSKVDYFSTIYSKMHRGIIPHEFYVDEASIKELSDFDFVFIFVDKPISRKLISDFLHQHKIPFIDAGIDIQLIEEEQCLIGSCRITMSTPDQYEHFPKHVSLNEDNSDDLYNSNIQIADMNALNAVMAVIKWKKHCGFYQDNYYEHQSTYAINTHQLTREELACKKPT